MSELAEGEAAAGGRSQYKPSFDFMDSLAWRLMAAPFHCVFSFTMPTPSSFRSPAGAAAHGSYAMDDSLAGLALTPGSQIAYNGAYWLSSID